MPASPEFLAAAREVADFLFLRVRENKGDEAAENCFAGVRSDDIALIIAKHITAPRAARRIQSGLDDAPPISGRGHKPDATPAHPTVIQEIAPELNAEIKKLIKARRAHHKIGTLAMALSLNKEIIKAAVEAPDSGLVMQGDNVKIRK